jgi:hypothetical protein
VGDVPDLCLECANINGAADDARQSALVGVGGIRVVAGIDGGAAG